MGCHRCPLFLNKPPEDELHTSPLAHLGQSLCWQQRLVSGCLGASGSILLGVTFSANLGPGSAQEEKVCLCSR